MDLWDELGRIHEDLEARLRRLEAAPPSPPSPPTVDPCPAQVTRCYQEELGRAPDPGGYANWLRACREGMGEAEMRERFRESDEYRGVQPPSNPPPPAGRTAFGPWTYGFEPFGPAWRFFLRPVQRGGWKGSSLDTGIYPWIQWREDYRNPITGGPDGRLIREDGTSVAGRWSLGIEKRSERILRLTWSVAIDEPVPIYGATAILDLPPAFRRYASNAEAVYNTTQMSNVNPRSGELPDAKAKGWPEAGFAVRDFDWLELSDGEFTIRRTTFGGWHDPPTADLLLDVQNVATWELGWFNGTWRDLNNLSPLSAPVSWTSVEEISVAGPGF